MCNHVWRFEQEKRGKRAGMKCKVSRYVCDSCSKRKYRPSLSYVLVAGLYKERIKSANERIAYLERALALAESAEREAFEHTLSLVSRS